MKRDMERGFALIFVVMVAGMTLWWVGSVRAAPAQVGPAETAVIPSPDWQQKVDAQLLQAQQNEPVEFIIYLTQQADLSGAYLLDDKVAKGQYVYNQLRATAKQSQAALQHELSRQGITFRSFLIANMIVVRAETAVLPALAQRADIAHIYASQSLKLEEPIIDNTPPLFAPATAEWGISQTGAPAAWELGFTGQGAVIGGQDTGYLWDHLALKNQYRGWNGITATHVYNWYDAIHVANADCDANSPEPCDDYGHGTHTMGTMIGDDGAGNQIGMAPGAEWIACRNMNDGNGTPVTYSECFEWFLAPYPQGGDPLNDGDPAKAPHVINNSWYCPVSEGCTSVAVFQTIVENLRAAGIVVVVSAGNFGSGCSTVAYAPTTYEASFSVGATDGSNNIASFSSRGPVTVDGSNRLKPNISAPGVSIRSSTFFNPGSYGYMNGTSMAGPHVAGAVALLISAKPLLAGQVDFIEAALMKTAVPRTTTQNCGTIPGSQVPNHTYGYGIVDARAAITAVLGSAVAPALAGQMALTDTLQLSWPSSTTSCFYDLYRADIPYLAMNGEEIQGRLDFDQLTSSQSITSGQNSYFQLVGVGCDSETTAVSNTIGKFSYVLNTQEE